METTKAESENKTYHLAAGTASVCCPPKDQVLWNQHPRVYLDVEKSGEVKCPYCGNHFVVDSRS